VALCVGLLHYTAPPVVGGVEIVLGHHARLLAAAGHSVRVITGRGGRFDLPVGSVRVPLADARHPRVRTARAALDAGRVPTDWPALVDELADQLRSALAGLDVVVAHNVCSLHFNLPLTAALRRLLDESYPPRLIAWQHDVAATSPRHRRSLHDGPPWDLLRTPWPGVRYVTISASRRDEVAMALGIPRQSVTVIPNGLDIDCSIALHATTRRLIAPLRLERAGPILLMPTRVIARKNVELAIRVVAELRRAGDDARLIVTGPPDPHDPGDEGYLEWLLLLADRLGVTEAVHLLAIDRGRPTAPRAVADLYRLADVLFLPSTDEGFGLPILEAAVCRLPIVCADIAPLRDLAGEEATYIDPGAEPGDVARVIREVLTSPAPRLSSRVRSRYGWPAVYERHIAPLLTDVAASGQRVSSAMPTDR
jgi:mannosylglucosylglycerate synthase